MKNMLKIAAILVAILGAPMGASAATILFPATGTTVIAGRVINITTTGIATPPPAATYDGYFVQWSSPFTGAGTLTSGSFAGPVSGVATTQWDNLSSPSLTTQFIGALSTSGPTSFTLTAPSGLPAGSSVTGVGLVYTAAVPEPDTATALALSLLGFFGIARRRS